MELPAHGMSILGCPYAMHDTLYITCPRVTHGLPGEPCSPDCPDVVQRRSAAEIARDE